MGKKKKKSRIEEPDKEVTLKCKKKGCGMEFREATVDKNHKVYCKCGYCFGDVYDVEIVRQIIINNKLGKELDRIKADVDKVSKIVAIAKYKKININKLIKRKNRLKAALKSKRKEAENKWDDLDKDFLKVKSSSSKSKLGKSKIDALKKTKEALKNIYPDIYDDNFVEDEIAAIKKKGKQDAVLEGTEKERKSKIMSTYITDIVKLQSKIDITSDELYKLYELSNEYIEKHTKKGKRQADEDKLSITKLPEVYLDNTVKKLSKHFRERTSNPRDDLTGRLFLLFGLFKKHIKDGDFKKAQSRVKQRRSTLNA